MKELTIYSYELKNYYYNKFNCYTTTLLNELIESKLLDKNSKAEIIKVADKVAEQYKYELHNVWNTDDIVGTAENINLKITEEQAVEFLEHLYSSMDASIGISWDVIETLLKDYLEEDREDPFINKYINN